ncbi:MAG: TOMM precursor leader peptide-binding protein [Gemmatimonadota bacterium]|nr:TOMM precursor leader peptide-binding protein [Gemmatimonadota bacterium]
MIDDEQVLLVSEAFNTLLRGRIHRALMPLLDGGRTVPEIVAALAPAHSAHDVRTAILALASRGYLVSGDYSMAPGRAAYWSSFGASPRWAERRLAAAAVAVAGDDGVLARRLGGLGVQTGRQAAAVRPSLAVIVCADYLDERHDSINRRHLESRTPWVLVRPNGMQPLFGPVFRPAEGGACWACLAYRLRGHQEVHGFLRNLRIETSAVEPRAAEPAVVEAVCGLAAAEIAKWLVLEDLAPIHERAVSLDIAAHHSAQHPAMRRPQCLACGDEALYRADRSAEPVRLRASPKGFRNSGGHRSVPPEVTLARYRHLVSPVTGVVTWLTRTAEETDPWLHVYWAGSNLAPRGRKLRSLRRSLRSKSAGKGSSPQQSEASALCEAVERYCGAFHGDEIRSRKRLMDFEKAGEAEAIPPNEVQLFSDRQLDDAQRINACGHPYNFVPPRLDPDAEIDWTPVWSLTEGRHRYLPTSILYGVVEAGEGHEPGFKADSNGCAAGNTLEEAILQGFLELVERDAFGIWWYNRLRLPEVDLTSFGDAYLASARDYYRRRNREIWVLDASSDFGIPVFVAISRRTDGDTEDIIYGAGAHMDPHIAALRAVCELNQCLQWILGPARGGVGAAVHDPVSASWWRTGKLADHPYLAPAPGAAPRGRSDYPVPDTADTRDDVEHCRALVEARGMEFLVLDQTRPDIGMPVVRVIVPGMRHFWERFAPGRLFDVPVSMGWRANRLSEKELNPVPVVA